MLAFPNNHYKCMDYVMESTLKLCAYVLIIHKKIYNLPYMEVKVEKNGL